MTARIPHLNQRVLTVFLLVSLPALIVGTLLVLRVGQNRLSESYGRHLQDVAQQAAAGVDAYVYRRILDVSLLARTPDLRREATAGSTRPFDRAAAEAMDREWQQSRQQPPPVAQALKNAASQYLADIVAHDRIYREMILTDRHGRLIAASNPTTDFFQGDEDWWLAAFDDGRRGRVSIGDVRWDPSASAYAIEISAPVSGLGDESVAGVLKVVSDSREMLALVGNLQLGQTGSAWLLRRNGTIVFGRYTTDPKARFFASDTLKQRMDALWATGPIGTAHFTAPDSGWREARRRSGRKPARGELSRAALGRSRVAGRVGAGRAPVDARVVSPDARRAHSAHRRRAGLVVLDSTRGRCGGHRHAPGTTPCGVARRRVRE